MNYGYARCSTNESKQDIHRQIKELKAAGAETIVFEYEHGDAKIKKELEKNYKELGSMSKTRTLLQINSD